VLSWPGIILFIPDERIFSLLTLASSESGKLMMFCLLYGRFLNVCKKRLDREIPAT